jgi:hypothetical protein
LENKDQKMSDNQTAKPNPIADIVSPDVCVTKDGSLLGTLAIVLPEDAFDGWASEVEVEARRVLDRPTGDIAWLIGGPEDMRGSFEDAMSPGEYVQAQVENID